MEQKKYRLMNKTYKRIVSSSSGSVAKQEMVAILGPSGAGKTSLLNILAKRESTRGGSYSSGSINLGQKPLRASDFGKSASFVQQDDILNGSLTPRELLIFACRIRLNLPTGEAEARADLIIG
jgi:ABC-type multidrug transport system ATPase subunit